MRKQSEEEEIFLVGRMSGVPVRERQARTGLAHYAFGFLICSLHWPATEPVSRVDERIEAR